MAKNRDAAKLNQMTLALQAERVWMVDESSVAAWHAAMLDAWESRELPERGVFCRIPASETREPYTITAGVAVIPVAGMIRSKEDLWTHYGLGTANSSVAAAVESAMGRSDVQGVLLVVDSGGGSALGNEEAARRMAAAKAASGKPLWAVADGVAASAAYYLAVPADRIVATPGSSVGSIGCITVHAQWRPEDVTFTVTRFGKMKVVPHPLEPIGDAGKAEQQRVVDQLGQMFLSTVAEFRRMTPSEAESRFADGRVFYDRAEMQRVGMIDGSVDSVADAVRQMAATFAASSSLQARCEASCVVNHESGTRAAESATHEEKYMNPKVKAALYARGLIASLDASNDICEAAVAAYFAGRGQDKPADDAAVLSALTTANVAAVAEPLKPAGNVQAAHDREQAEARLEARRHEAERAKQIRERGAKLGASAEIVEAAVLSDATPEQAVVQMLDKLAAARPPVVAVEASGEKQFAQDAMDALLMRCNVAVEKPSEQAKKWGRNGVPLLHLAKQALAIQGARFDEASRPEEIAAEAMFATPMRSQILMDDSSGVLNRPSSFPNLLSGVANKLFSVGMERASPSYPAWTGRAMEDLPDLREVPFVSRSQPYIMDEVIDDEKLKQFRLAEECLSLIQVRRFANKFGWTPTMVANDSLGAFAEGLIAFGGAWESTVNLLCLGLITGNVTLLNGVSLYDNSTHANTIESGSGGACSAAQMTLMQNKYAAQRPVGGQGYMRGMLDVVLIPPQLREAAMQTFAAFGSVPEVKNPATDATINIYRGTARIVEEAELQASSTARWYAFRNESPAVVRVYQRGWGDGTQRRAWTDSETGTVWVAFEGRVGAAAKDYRTTVRNFGS